MVLECKHSLVHYFGDQLAADGAISPGQNVEKMSP
jgi:hypothetical protein